VGGHRCAIARIWTPKYFPFGYRSFYHPGCFSFYKYGSKHGGFIKQLRPVVYRHMRYRARSFHTKHAGADAAYRKSDAAKISAGIRLIKCMFTLSWSGSGNQSLLLNGCFTDGDTRE